MAPSHAAALNNFSKIEIRYSFSEIACALNQDIYVQKLGFKNFEWQSDFLRCQALWKALCAARQSGKSTINAAKPCHKAKYKKKSLNIVIACSEKQAFEDMDKILDFIRRDKSYPKLVRKSEQQIKLANGSRIIVVPATDSAARGYSKPDLILLDEASRIDDIVFQSGVLPMLTDSPNSELVVLSTPNGQMGFFYKICSGVNKWEKFNIISAFKPDKNNPLALIPVDYDEEYAKSKQFYGNNVHFYISPRHRNYSLNSDFLIEQGQRTYRQEFCTEFVEVEGAIFSYEDIANRFTPTEETVIENEPFIEPGEALKPRAIGGKYF